MSNYGANEILTEEEISELKEIFYESDANQTGTIDNEGEMDAVIRALEGLHLSIPSHKIRDIIQDIKDDQDGVLTLTEYFNIFINHSSSIQARVQKKNTVQKKFGLKEAGGTSGGSAAGTKHSHSDAETEAFVDWINASLANDPWFKTNIRKIDYENDLFEKVTDGIILCKMINLSAPKTIDERAINMDLSDKAKYRFHVIENQTLALNSAQSIGCNVVNIGPDELASGDRHHLVLGLTWQIIRIGLFAKINLKTVPELASLLQEKPDGSMETLQDLMNLQPEQILLRWFNYHLRQAHENGMYEGDVRTVSNFSNDIMDSENYYILLKRIAPEYRDKYSDGKFFASSHMNRAETVLDYAGKFNCRKFVKANDIVTGNSKLNMAFVAHLFNNRPGLTLSGDDLEDIERYIETEEELSIRNWMNSMGVEPYVNIIFVDCHDSLALFQLFDKIQPGIVNWDRVNKPPYKAMGGNIKIVENGNYAVELAKQLRFNSLEGTQGSDIRDGIRTLVLGLVWQMMRAYTLTILQKLSSNPNKPITEKEIIVWANQKLSSVSKKISIQIKGFKDPSISTSLPVLYLIDVIKPKTVNFKLVKGTKPDEVLEEEDKLKNAQYALSMARKIGAHCYALPTDLVGVKSKMVMTVFACLMEVDLLKKDEDK